VTAAYERQRTWRAYLTCTTCQTVVAVGPPEPDAAMAAYRLGNTNGGEDGLRHLDKCAGGALNCTTEEEPAPVPQPPLLTPIGGGGGGGRGRGPYQLSAARAWRGGRVPR
jgi:hypothetical protein